MPPRIKGKGKTFNSIPRTTDVGGVLYNREYYVNSYRFTSMHENKTHRFEVRQGDIGYVGDTANGNERSEIVTSNFRSTQSQYRAYSGTDYWISFAFMVEPGAPIISNYAIVGQFHDIPEDRDTPLSPPLCFVLDKTNNDTIGYTLQSRSDPNEVTTGAVPSVTRWRTTIIRGQYVNIVCRIRFDPFGAGQLQLWRDGIEEINLSNIPMGFNNVEDQAYWQYGIYRQANANTLAVRYTNMEQSPNSLFARVASPLPIPGNKGNSVSDNAPSGMRTVYKTNFVEDFAITNTGYKTNDTSQPCWHSQFAYDRRTPNNGELGFYSDPALYPTTNPFPLVCDGNNAKRHLRADKLKGALTVEGNSYNYYASLMSGKNVVLMSDGDMIECRMSFPGISGNRAAWPAFWLLPFPNVWPPEIDILEWPQDAGATNTVYYANSHANVTDGSGNVTNQQLSKAVNFATTTPPISGTLEGWHIYGCKVTSTRIIYYCDGVVVHDVPNRTPGKMWYPILNMAFGGGWPGDPVDGVTKYPMDVRLDWLKHYKPM